MSYPITTTSGSTIATISDGTVNTTATSLALIGKNYAGYGNFLNENYVKLLENFSNSTAPVNAITGQLWFDYTNNLLKVYSRDSTWKAISSSASGTTAPASPVIGDLWWDQANNQLKVWSGSVWVTVGPAYSSTSGTTGPVVGTIVDAGGTSHTVTRFFISNTVIAILSSSAAFIPQTSITGFPTIYPGFNLISSSALTGSQFTGDVSNALTLQGVTANQFLRSDSADSTAYQLGVNSLLVASDLTISATSLAANVYNGASDSNLDFYITKGAEEVKVISIDGATARTSISNAVSINGTVTAASTVLVEGLVTANAGVRLSGTVWPTTNNTGALGNVAYRFNSMHSTTANVITANVTTANVSTLVATSYIQNAVYANATVLASSITSPSPGMMAFAISESKFYGYANVSVGWVALN